MWTLQKTVKYNKDQINFPSSGAIFENFIWAIFLIHFSATQKAKNTYIEVIKTVSNREFELNKFFSKSPKILKEVSKISKAFYYRLRFTEHPITKGFRSSIGVLTPAIIELKQIIQLSWEKEI